MKSVLLIGMGKFGKTLGAKLLEMGDEVMIVDKNEDIINTLAPRYTNAVITNCMNIDNLRALDVPSFDACIVAISEDFQSSLEITSLLQECGAKYIVARAATEIQRKFLLKNGADEVIYPDMDIAEKLAIKINVHKVLDFFELDDKHSIFEIAVPAPWVGKSLAENNPRQKFGLNILMIKHPSEGTTTPNPAYIFQDGDTVVVFGETQTIINFTNKKNK